MKVVAIFSMLWALMYAYPSGPPTTACQSMTPSHGNIAPQMNSAPFSLSFKSDSNCYMAGQTYEVTLSSSPNFTFVGFLVQARKRNNMTYSFGTFNANSDPNIQTLYCFGVSASAIAHKNEDRARWSTKTFNWTAPSGMTKNLEFVATVVQSYMTFWVGMMTDLPCCGCPKDHTTVLATTTNQMSMSTMSSSIGVTSSPSLLGLLLLVSFLLVAKSRL